MKYFLLISCCIFIVLNQNAQTELWGMTTQGGQYGAGTIFKTNGSGNNQTIEYDFFQIDAAKPQLGQLIQANNGMFYGMTSLGGKYNFGVIFQYDPINDIYSKMVDFDGTSNGSYPQGSLVQATDGNLYGVTKNGGANDKGIVFQYNINTNVCTNKYSFPFGGINGTFPTGSLIQASDGMLYGLTSQGGSGSAGVLFQYDLISNIYTKKIDFFTNTHGSRPYGSLIQASDGNLYGLNYQGGLSNAGTLFQYNITSSTAVKKVDFDGPGIGSYPKGTLMQASDGNLYGLTSTGGLNNSGVVFQYDPVTSISNKKFDFDSTINGNKPYGSLIQTSTGNFYGMTSLGGTSNKGILFQYDLNLNTCTKRFDFDGTINGSNPQGTLMLANNGFIYGMASDNGVNAKGILFEFDPSANIYSKKLDFGWSINGDNPEGHLIMGQDGNFYGMTSSGGTNDIGTLFQYNPLTHSYSKKIDFIGSNGKQPRGSLFQASDGKIYGMTQSDGINDLGVLFEYDPVTNLYVQKFDFDGINGANPEGALVQGVDNNLYGVTYSGGTGTNTGVIFQFNPTTSIYQKKFDFFSITINGARPRNSLLLASNGNFYGTTTWGGTSFKGILFEYNYITNVFTKRINFTGLANGQEPRGSLIEATDGNLYGMTGLGGASNLGVLFQYNPTTNVLVKKIDFSGANGNQPNGTLIQASNGNLYGMTYSGGANQKGVIFQYDLTASSYSKKIDFNGINGSYPGLTKLVEAPLIITAIKQNSNQNNLTLYPNPNNGTFTIELKTKSHITITNTLGETVSNQLMETGNQNICIQSQVNGIYFVKITDAKGFSSTKKIVVQK